MSIERFSCKCSYFVTGVWLTVKKGGIYLLLIFILAHSLNCSSSLTGFLRLGWSEVLSRFKLQWMCYIVFVYWRQDKKVFYQPDTKCTYGEDSSNNIKWVSITNKHNNCPYHGSVWQLIYEIKKINKSPFDFLCQQQSSRDSRRISEIPLTSPVIRETESEDLDPVMIKNKN